MLKSIKIDEKRREIILYPRWLCDQVKRVRKDSTVSHDGHVTRWWNGTKRLLCDFSQWRSDSDYSSWGHEWVWLVLTWSSVALGFGCGGISQLQSLWREYLQKHCSCRPVFLDGLHQWVEPSLPVLVGGTLQLSLDTHLSGNVVDPQDVGVRMEGVPATSTQVTNKQTNNNKYNNNHLCTMKKITTVIITQWLSMGTLLQSFRRITALVKWPE